MARSPDFNDPKDEAPVQPRVNRDGTISPVLKPNEARAGETRGNMRYVLGFGIAGVVVLFAIAYLGFFGSGPADPPIGSPTVEQQATPPQPAAPDQAP